MMWMHVISFPARHDVYSPSHTIPSTDTCNSTIGVFSSTWYPTTVAVITFPTANSFKCCNASSFHWLVPAQMFILHHFTHPTINWLYICQIALNCLKWEWHQISSTPIYIHTNIMYIPYLSQHTPCHSTISTVIHKSHSHFIRLFIMCKCDCT